MTTWNNISDTNGWLPTAANAAASPNPGAIGNGWIDEFGSVFAINSHAITSTPAGGGGGTYQTAWLQRQSSEAFADSRIVSQFTWAATSDIYHYLRLSAWKGTGYAGLIYGSGNAAYIYKINGSTYTQLTTVGLTGGAPTVGHEVQCDFNVVGTALALVVTDVTTSTQLCNLTITDATYSTAGVQGISTFTNVTGITRLQTYADATSTYTLTGPTGGVISTASTNFTISQTEDLASSVTITPSDGGALGTFTPSSITLPAGYITSATFTYKPSATPSTVTISTTNSGGLTDPSSVTYKVTTLANAPTAISGLNLWLKQGTGLYKDAGKTTPVAADGDQIYVWADSSGAGNDVTQATANFRPVYDADNNWVISQNGNVIIGASTGQNYFNLPTGFTTNNNSFSIFFLMDLMTVQAMTSETGGNFTPSDYYSTTANICNFYLDSGGVGITLAAYDGSTAARVSSVTPPTSFAMVGFVASATGVYIYINGVLAQTVSALMAATDTTGGSIFGVSTPNSTLQGRIIETFAYNAAVSSLDIGTLWAYAQNKGVVSNTITSNYNLCVQGDSISYGYNATYNRGWVEDMQFISGFPSGMTVYNSSLSGAELSTILTNAATQCDTLKAAGKTNILIVFAGTNDIYIGGASAATVYANLQTYCTARKTAGWNKIIVVTMLPRSSGANEATRITYNSDIRAGFSGATLACDAVADVASNSLIGLPGDNTNTTYYSPDAVHPINAGYAIIASIVQPYVNSFVSPSFASANIPSAGTTINVLITDFNPPMLPASGATGFTVLVNGVSRSISSTSVSGSTIILTLSSVIYSTDTVTISYTPGNVTDTSLNALPSFGANNVTNNSSQSAPSSGGIQQLISGGVDNFVQQVIGK